MGNSWLRRTGAVEVREERELEAKYGIEALSSDLSGKIEGTLEFGWRISITTMCGFP